MGPCVSWLDLLALEGICSGSLIFIHTVVRGFQRGLRDGGRAAERMLMLTPRDTGRRGSSTSVANPPVAFLWWAFCSWRSRTSRSPRRTPFIPDAVKGRKKLRYNRGDPDRRRLPAQHSGREGGVVVYNINPKSVSSYFEQMSLRMAD